MRELSIKEKQYFSIIRNIQLSCMYIQTNDVCTYKQTIKHTKIHMLMCTYICTYIRTYIHTYVHMCMYACIHTYVCTYVHMYVCTCIQLTNCLSVRLSVCLSVHVYFCNEAIIQLVFIWKRTFGMHGKEFSRHWKCPKCAVKKNIIPSFLLLEERGIN